MGCNVMNVRKHQLIVMLVMTFAIGFFGAILTVSVLKPHAGNNAPSNIILSDKSNKSLDESLQNVRVAYDLINEHYYEEVDPEALLEGAIQGMLDTRSEEHTSELQSRFDLVCRLLLE